VNVEQHGRRKMEILSGLGRRSGPLGRSGTASVKPGIQLARVRVDRAERAVPMAMDRQGFQPLPASHRRHVPVEVGGNLLLGIEPPTEDLRSRIYCLHREGPAMETSSRSANSPRGESETQCGAFSRNEQLCSSLRVDRAISSE
jgi:hypothetical protein